MSAALVARGLSAGYGSVAVLHGLDLEVPSGALVAIVGPNGAGKSTLLMALAGLLARAGEVTLDGAPLPAGRPAAAVRRGLALVPEGRHLFAHMSVRENLELGGFLLSARERRRRLEWALELFPRLRERQGQRAGSMSGGEQQMLAIGRALVGRPRLIMLDEASLGLAPRLVDELFATALRIRAEGVGVLLVEQHVDKALAIADHAYVLERGRVVAQGPGPELLRSDRIREAYLGVA